MPSIRIYATDTVEIAGTGTDAWSDPENVGLRAGGYSEVTVDATQSRFLCGAYAATPIPGPVVGVTLGVNAESVGAPPSDCSITIFLFEDDGPTDLNVQASNLQPQDAVGDVSAQGSIVAGTLAVLKASIEAGATPGVFPNLAFAIQATGGASGACTYRVYSLWMDVEYTYPKPVGELIIKAIPLGLVLP